MVGQSFGPGVDTPTRPITWQNGTMKDLGVLPNDGDVEAQAISWIGARLRGRGQLTQPGPTFGNVSEILPQPPHCTGKQ